MSKWNQDDSEPQFQSKRGFFEKFLNLLGIEAVEELEEAEPAVPGNEPPLRPDPKERGKVLSLTNPPKNVKVIIIEPVTFDEVQGMVDQLKNKRALVLNLEATEKQTARRIADFMGGAVYALEGTMQKISDLIFLLTPAQIEVTVPLRAELKTSDPGSGLPIFPSTLFRNDRDY